jgi:hypothetical protein
VIPSPWRIAQISRGGSDSTFFEVIPRTSVRRQSLLYLALRSNNSGRTDLTRIPSESAEQLRCRRATTIDRCATTDHINFGGTMAITIDDIEALRRRLAELPRNQPTQVSKQEAIALLATELGAARRRGYSPDDLAQMLSEQGVAINAATLRGYLRRNQRTRKRRDGKATASGRKDSGTVQPARSNVTPAESASSVAVTTSARSASTTSKELAATEAASARGPTKVPTTAR